MAKSALTSTLQTEYDRLVRLLADYNVEYIPKSTRLKTIQSWNDATYYGFWTENNGKCNFSRGACITSWTNPETGRREPTSGSITDINKGVTLYNFVKESLLNWTNEINTLTPRVTVLKNQIETLNGSGVGSIAKAKKELDDSINNDNTKNLTPEEKASISKTQNYKTALTVGVVLVVIIVGVWLWYKYLKK